MTLIYEKRDKIAQITFNRPKAMNAFNMEMIKSFSRALIDFRDDEDAWVLIITGAGEKAFSAGYDLNEQMPAKFPPMITRGIDINKPIIAAVNGVALGGGLEVALACDFRIASDDATMGLPETRWGLMPGWGGTQRLPRLISPAKAAEMILLAKVVSAKEALEIGLVNKVVSSAELMKTAIEWAARICELGPIAVRTAKMVMNKGLTLSLGEGLKLEEQMFGEVLKTDDAREGPKAFIHKRSPEFKGR